MTKEKSSTEKTPLRQGDQLHQLEEARSVAAQSEPERRKLAKDLAVIIKNTKVQLYIDWVKYIQEQSNDITLNKSDIVNTFVALLSVYFGGISAMPYVNTPAKLAVLKGWPKPLAVCPSFYDNGFLNTWSIQRFFSGIVTTVWQDIQNLFFERKAAEMNFEFRKNFDFIWRKWRDHFGTLAILTIITFIATTQALTVAFKEHKEIVLADDSGLLPEWLNPLLNAADFGSYGIQASTIIFANFALMYIAVRTLWNLLISSKWVTRLTKAQDPASQANREVDRSIAAIHSFIKDSMENFKAQVFYLEQSGGTEDTKALFKLIRKRNPRNEDIIEILKIKQKIESDAGPITAPKTMASNSLYECLAFIATMLLFSIQAYFFLPIRPSIDPTDTPTNPSVDPLPIPDVQHPNLVMALFVIEAVMLVGFHVKEVLWNYYSGDQYSAEDKFRNTVVGLMRKTAMFGVTCILVGNWETAYWFIAQIFGLPLQPKDISEYSAGVLITSYMLGIALASIFGYLAINMSSPDAATMLANIPIQMYQHYKSFNLSFGSYLKTLITIPSNFKTIIHAPYLFVLHPFTAIMPILLAFAFAPFSTATAQKLNHELFGEMVAEYLLKVPTIIAITLFNVMGIPSVFFDFYRYLTRVGFTLSDKINACRDINPVNEDDEVDYSGVMGKVRYLTDYRKTRDLYHFLAFCDTFNSGLERMDVTYLYLNLLQAVLPTEIQPLSDADRSWQEYQLRTKALETFMNFTQESASKMVKNIAQPPREAVLTTQQFNSIMPLYFGNAQPNTIIPTVDPSIQRYDDVKNFQALLGRPYNGIISSLSTPAESRTRVKNDRFFADGASGEFACVHDADARMILAQHGNIQEGNRQSNSL